MVGARQNQKKFHFFSFLTIHTSQVCGYFVASFLKPFSKSTFIQDPRSAEVSRLRAQVQSLQLQLLQSGGVHDPSQGRFSLTPILTLCKFFFNLFVLIDLGGGGNEKQDILRQGLFFHFCLILFFVQNSAKSLKA